MKTLAKILFVLTILIGSYSCGDTSEDPTPIFKEQPTNNRDNYKVYKDILSLFDGQILNNVEFIGDHGSDKQYLVTTDKSKFYIIAYNIDLGNRRTFDDVSNPKIIGSGKLIPIQLNNKYEILLDNHNSINFIDISLTEFLK